MKNFKTLLGISAMSLLFTSSAFAVAGEDLSVGGSYGTLSEDKTESNYYTYDNWIQGAVSDQTLGTASDAYANLTVGAGSTFTYSTEGSAYTLSLDNVYLYGDVDSSSVATFKQAKSSGKVEVSGDMILDYGSYSQSAVNYLTVGGAIKMSNGSTFNVIAGILSTTDFSLSDTSSVNIFGATNTGNPNTISITGTLSLAGSSTFSVIENTGDSSSLSATNVTIAKLIIADSATYDMAKTSVKTDTLTITDSLTMTGGSFTKTNGTLTFDTANISISGSAEFTANTVTFNGTGSISLVVTSLDSTDGATIEGSINLGTVTLTDSILTLYLDISTLGDLSDVVADETAFDLSDFITISNEVLTDDNFEVYLTDANGDLDTDYSASFDSTNGTITFVEGGVAVPEPSTYALILGVFALGFAYYRRRK